tara:strand:- start:72 stop:362 length:291 start_codon:yes stop_codon:yes gene_type:complete
MLKNMKTINKKGQMSLGQVPGAVQLLVVIAIFLAVGALIVQSVQDNDAIEDGSTAFNVTSSGLAGLESLGDFQSLIAIVIAAAVVLGLVALIGFRG